MIAGFAWVGETVRLDPADFPALTLPVIVSGLPDFEDFL